MERSSLRPDRARRVWAIAQRIADEPGHSRRELADTFHVSERQVQADLVIIRDLMRLPLVRRSGYRFLAEGAAMTSGCSGGLTLQDALTLVTTLGVADGHRSDAERERIDALAVKLPVVFPPHLQPLVTRMLDAVRAPRSGRGRLFVAVADAILNARWIRLHEEPGTEQTPLREPMVRPELLMPYLGGWYIVARVLDIVDERLLCLDHVQAVTLAGVPDGR